MTHSVRSLAPVWQGRLPGATAVESGPPGRSRRAPGPDRRGDDSHRKPIGTLRGMPEGDDPEGASGPPPHPLDRVWFHPTELSAYMSATASRRGHRTWFVG